MGTHTLLFGTEFFRDSGFTTAARHEICALHERFVPSLHGLLLMPSKKSANRIRDCDVQGLKYLKVLSPLLKRLHFVGKERDKAQQRSLTMDRYCTLILLWLYSPVIDSLRGLQQASQLQKVQKRFGVSKTSLGSLSESVRIFDPEPLKQIAQELGDLLPRGQQRRVSKDDSQAKLERLSSLGKTLTAVDGSIVKVLSK